MYTDREDVQNCSFVCEYLNVQKHGLEGLISGVSAVTSAEGTRDIGLGGVAAHGGTQYLLDCTRPT